MNDSFLNHFEFIIDPRIERCKKYKLLDILLLAISAVISGAEGWEDIENAFQSCISQLIKKTGSDIIAVDGKTAVNEKSNEITAISELLNLLDIEQCTITLDAMGCQEKIVQQIIQQKADFILALKGNHSGMQAELEAWWHKVEREGISNKNYDKHTDISSGHGRIEIRKCQQILLIYHGYQKIFVGKG